MYWLQGTIYWRTHIVINTNSMKSTLVDGNLIESSMADSHPPRVATKRSTPLSIITNMSSNLEDNHILDSPGHNVECSSPIPRFCDGFTCRESSLNTEEPERADVVSLKLSKRNIYWDYTDMLVFFSGLSDNLGNAKWCIHVSNSRRISSYVRSRPRRWWLKSCLLTSPVGHNPNPVFQDLMIHIW